MLSQLRKTRLGFTLVELAIVLAVAGLLFGGLWRLLSGGNQQLRDQSAASSQTTLINSIKAFLATQGGQYFLVENFYCTLTTAPGAVVALNPGQKYCASNLPAQLDLPSAAAPAGTSGCVAGYPNGGANSYASGLCNYLPSGFSSSTTNSYNQTFKIIVLRDGTAAGQIPSTYSFMVMSVGGDPIPDTSGGRIAASIGGDGGFIYQSTTPICGTLARDACGAYGAWFLDPVAVYGYTSGVGGDDQGGTANGGQVATRTFVSPGQTSTFPWLARSFISGDSAYNFNTMVTGLYMGATTAGPIATVNMQGGNINMNSTPGATPAPLGTGGGNFFMSGGSINMASATAGPAGINMNTTPLNTNGGAINMAGGTMDLAGGFLVDSTAGNGAILLTHATSGTGNSVITATMPCTIQSYNAVTSQWVDGGGNPCNFAITTTSVTVSGLLSALGFYAGTFVYNGSDIRLKRDIHPLTDALDNIMRLKPVTFTYKSTGQESMGVIAQDLEKVYPQLIGVGDNGMKHVAYDGLIAPLISSVQELKKDNDDLRIEVKALKQRQDQLEGQIKNDRNK